MRDPAERLMLVAPAGGDAATGPGDAHAYPADLARVVLRRWAEMGVEDKTHLKPPDLAGLTHVLSICYQASLLREEGRPVTFRLALSEPGVFDSAGGPPSGLHRLIFDRARPLDRHELRRLAPAAAFPRSLIGAWLRPKATAEIWGVIHSGPQWLQSVRGGRQTEQAIPPGLMVKVTGPGILLVSVGATSLADLRHGTLAARDLDVFNAPWLRNTFAHIGQEPPAMHPHPAQSPGGMLATVDPGFGAFLAAHVLRRAVSTIRAAQHGGTLIIVPDHRATQLIDNGRLLDVKYRLSDEEPRRRILTLTNAIVSELARDTGDTGQTVGWDAYEASQARTLTELDHALFEVAHLTSDLAQIDGAVLLTDRLEILGFGVEIAGDLPDVVRVARAHDLAGEQREWVRTDRVGTRHRSAYRFCQAVHDALVVVVSQDGGLRFTRWHEDGVVYWEQIATAPQEI